MMRGISFIYAYTETGDRYIADAYLQAYIWLIFFE